MVEPQDSGLQSGEQSLEETVENLSEEERAEESDNRKVQRALEKGSKQDEGEDIDSVGGKTGGTDYDPEEVDKMNTDPTAFEEEADIVETVNNYFTQVAGTDDIDFFEGSAGSLRIMYGEDSVIMSYEPDNSLMFNHNIPNIQGEPDHVPFEADLLILAKEEDFDAYSIKAGYEDLEETVERLSEVDEYLFDNSTFPEERLAEYFDEDLTEYGEE